MSQSDSEDQQEEETGGNMATADASTDDMNLEQLRAEVAKARRERDNKKVSFKAPLPSGRPPRVWTTHSRPPS